MPDIRKIAKPQIWLRGNLTKNGSSFSERVDHSVALSGHNVVNGVSTLWQDDILSFDRNVQIIITGQAPHKASYNLRTVDTNNLKYEGRINQDKKSINYFSETYYTFGEKEPLRNSTYLYNLLDMDSLDDDEGNIGALGFSIQGSPTDSELITLKAKTYHDGRHSDTAVAIFKINHLQDTLEFNGENTVSNL